MNTQPFDQSFKLLKNTYRFGVAMLLSLAFFIASTAQVLASPQVTFNGTNLGAIPDGLGVFNQNTGGGCQVPGPPRDVAFNVSGLTGNVQTVTVTISFSTATNPPGHSYVGDLVVTLIAPNNTRQLDLFGYTRATTASGAGDGSFAIGPYTFADTATQSWWEAARVTGETDPIPSGSYRTSQRGGAGSTGADTSLNATFSGLTAAQANGTWILRFTDGCQGDTGTVSAAALDITTATNPPIAAKPFFDYFGSGKSSFAVYNDTSTAYIIWRVLNNGGAGQETVFWGLNTDFLTPGYYDADNRADIAVWRASATPGESRYFIRNTSPVSLNVIPFGSGNDIGGATASYDADYDGDGRDDPTLLRRVNGQWLWSYRASSTNTLRSVAFGIATGSQTTDDVPMAGGDFSGDGRADLVVIRRNASGPETIIWGDSVTGQQISSFIWGEYNTDFYILGDFLGDSRMDFAVWRGFGSTADGNWYIRENGGNGFVARFLGNPSTNTVAGDIAVAGDFGGDSKYDIAIYRPSNNTFYWYNSVTDLQLRATRFGEPGDRPVGELRTY